MIDHDPLMESDIRTRTLAGPPLIAFPDSLGGECPGHVDFESASAEGEFESLRPHLEEGFAGVETGAGLKVIFLIAGCISLLLFAFPGMLLLNSRFGLRRIEAVSFQRGGPLFWGFWP